MGEWGICCGKAALSECASLCSMPQGQGRVSQTLHRNYLLPINSKIEQGEMDESMAGVGNNISPTPVPSVDNAPAGAGLSGMVTSSTAGQHTPG